MEVRNLLVTEMVSLWSAVDMVKDHGSLRRSSGLRRNSPRVQAARCRGAGGGCSGAVSPGMKERRFDEQAGTEALVVLEETQLKVGGKPEKNKDSTTAGSSRRGAAPSPGRGALHALLLSSGSSNEGIRETRSATRRENLKGSVKVTRTQVWADVTKAGADGGRLDGKSK